MITAGTEAPDFCLKNQDDKEVSLKDNKDKWIVLYFYPKDNTSGCTKEACDFTELFKDYKKLNAVILESAQIAQSRIGASLKNRTWALRC